MTRSLLRACLTSCSFVPLRGRFEFRNPKSAFRNRSAFTLIEMLTTVAVLVIVLGLMVSLARYVRNRSAAGLTRDLLSRLDRTMAQYKQASLDQLPPVGFPPPEVDEISLSRWATAGNVQFVRSLRAKVDLSAGALAELPIFIYDQRMIRDTWGTPILFMPRQHPQVGLALGDRFFFVSAGPDRQFLTRGDNLYSYDVVKEE
jgi:prepilin-type N-terminal cleavage/methylation domain-containing protein